MYDIVITWQRTYGPHTVFEKIASLGEAIATAEKTVTNNERGQPRSIKIFEGGNCIASLRIIR